MLQFRGHDSDSEEVCTWSPSSSQYTWRIVSPLPLLCLWPSDYLETQVSPLPLLGARDSFLYHNVVWGLQYLALTRPNISFAINKLCQFFSQPTDVNWEAVKQILRYVKRTLRAGLSFHNSSSTGIIIFTDANRAGCVDVRRSTSFFMCLSDQISFHGVWRNNLQSRGLVPRLSIRHWPKVL
jgi:hypothetical protein